MVGLAVAGRFVAGPKAGGSAEPEAQGAVADVDAPTRTPLATLDSNARPTVIPFLPLMPFVADRRETGTDGLIGRLPCDLPRDPVAPRVNRFTIDDVVATWTTWDTTPPWVRRLGFMSSHQTDPYER